jgi:serine/threonine-protein kinase HipA
MLKRPSSPSYIGALIKVVDTWQQHFAQVGVSEEDVESLALRIDGEWLWGQRRLFGN